jgi:hypothetical protein
VRSEPLDEDGGAPIIHRDYQAIGIPLDIENYSARSHDAGMSIAGFNVGRVFPNRLRGLLKP